MGLFTFLILFCSQCKMDRTEWFFCLQDPDQLLLAQLQQGQKRHQYPHAPLFGMQHLLKAQGLPQREHGEDLRHAHPGRDLFAADLVMFEMSRAFYHTLHIKGELNQRNIGRQWLEGAKIGGQGGGDKNLPLHPWQLVEALASYLETARTLANGE